MLIINRSTWLSQWWVHIPCTDNSFYQKGPRIVRAQGRGRRILPAQNDQQLDQCDCYVVYLKDLKHFPPHNIKGELKNPVMERDSPHQFALRHKKGKVWWSLVNLNADAALVLPVLPRACSRYEFATLVTMASNLSAMICWRLECGSSKGPPDLFQNTWTRD